MFINGIDAMDYVVTMETLMLEDELLVDEAIADLEIENDDFESAIITEEINTDSLLYKLCNNNYDCNFDKINLIVIDISFDIEIYHGLAKDYSYNWNIDIDSYRLYNENGKTFLAVWCNYPYTIID